MGTFLKYIAIGVVVFVVYIAIVVFATNSEFVSELLEDGSKPKKSNQPQSQQVQNSGGHVEIAVALEERMGLKFEHIHLCTPAEHEDEPFFDRVISKTGDVSSGCVNNDCQVSVALEKQETIPEYIYMYVSNGGAGCRKTKFETSGSLDVLGYAVTIEFTNELKKALGITSENFTVDSRNSREKFSTQMMGNKTTVLTYEHKPSSDQLMIDGKVKGNIRFL